MQKSHEHGRVIVAHEWIINIAGSEQVFRAIAEGFPEADLVVGVADPAQARRLFPDRPVKSLLSHRLPFIRSHWHLYAPLLLWAWRRYRADCDLLIVSSHFAAHQACRRTKARSVVYYHTPMRLAWRWDLEHDRVHGVLRRLFGTLVVPLLKVLDRQAAKRVDVALANSEETASRIRKYFGRSAEVVHPPVTPPQVALNDQSARPAEPYYLVLGRLVPYKRVDIAVEACSSLGRRLIVAGDGPQRYRLTELAGPSISFVGEVSEEEKATLLKHATALLFPGEEDFGIVPVEALASGTPVIAYGAGGALETVTLDVGEFFGEQIAESLVQAMLRLEGRHITEQAAQSRAQIFDAGTFRGKFAAAIRDF